MKIGTVETPLVHFVDGTEQATAGHPNKITRFVEIDEDYTLEQVDWINTAIVLWIDANINITLDNLLSQAPIGTVVTIINSTTNGHLNLLGSFAPGAARTVLDPHEITQVILSPVGWEIGLVNSATPALPPTSFHTTIVYWPAEYWNTTDVYLDVSEYKKQRLTISGGAWIAMPTGLSDGDEITVLIVYDMWHNVSFDSRWRWPMTQNGLKTFQQSGNNTECQYVIKGVYSSEFDVIFCNWEYYDPYGY